MEIIFSKLCHATQKKNNWIIYLFNQANVQYFIFFRKLQDRKVARQRLPCFLFVFSLSAVRRVLVQLD